MNWRKWLRWFLYFILFILLVLFSIIAYFSTKDMAADTKTLEKKFAEVHLPIHVKEFNYKSSTFRYVSRNTKTEKKPLLCFIQGAPMTLNDFQFYNTDSTISDHYDIITPERPGYGKRKEDTAMIDIKQQADYISSLILSIKDTNQSVVLLSHSYGGAIASMVSYILDSLVKAHVMLAPVIDPDHEKIFWYSPLPLKFPLKYIVNKQFKTASHEKMNHAMELKKIAPYFSTIHSPVYHYHGLKDFLAPKENIDFVKNSFDVHYLQQFIFPDKGHFMSNEVVRKRLVDIANNID